MNQRQRAFCEAYLLSGNATEAAIKAGYSPKSARSIGQRLLTYVDIREYLAQRNAQIITENTATLEEIYSFWTVTMRDQASKPADRLKASELLSKALIVERTLSGRPCAPRPDALPDQTYRPCGLPAQSIFCEYQSSFL